MRSNKLTKILLWALLGPIVGLSFFFGFDGMQSFSPKDGFETKMEAIGLIGLISYIIAFIAMGCFCYSKKERKLDQAISGHSDVDMESTHLLGAIQHQLDPVEEDVNYSIVDSQELLRIEIMKARRSGASNEDIAGYLERELDNWIMGTRFVHSDFEAFTQIIDELQT